MYIYIYIHTYTYIYVHIYIYMYMHRRITLVITLCVIKFPLLDPPFGSPFWISLSERVVDGAIRKFISKFRKQDNAHKSPTPLLQHLLRCMGKCRRLQYMLLAWRDITRRNPDRVKLICVKVTFESKPNSEATFKNMLWVVSPCDLDLTMTFKLKSIWRRSSPNAITPCLQTPHLYPYDY